MRMKTDRYKDWESKFFAGEELTPKEELFLKNESDNPYFSFIKEEKQEKMDLSFEDFLRKTEEPKIVALPKKSNFRMYWMAASLVLLMGFSAFWMFNKTEKTTPVIVKNENPKQENPSEKSITSKTEIPVLANRENQETDIETQQKKAENSSTSLRNLKDSAKPMTNEKYIAQQKTENTKIHIIDENYEKSTSDYNPNYVIVNGKPIYNEQEAIAVTEDAFNYFASNVTQTINQAENAENVSKNLNQIINF